MAPAERITFEGSQGAALAARLDAPLGTILAYAVFAHCFTCSKDVLAASRIAAELARRGIAVLRFDFTGLGPPAVISQTPTSPPTSPISSGQRTT